MPSILTEYEGVEFIAARDFTYFGHEYKMGDDVPDAKSFKNLESMVRSRRLIPVVAEGQPKPYQFRHVVQEREFARKKLGLDPKPKQTRRKAKKDD